MNERDWDEVAEYFEAEIFNVPDNDTKGLIRHWVQRLAAPRGAATDLGCGVGRTLPMLAEHFGTVYAVDVSSRCLAIAAGSAADHSNVQYVHADLSAQGNAYPATDLVLCINTLLNASLEVRGPLFDRTCRSVKRGGHLVLVVPSLNSALLTAYRHLQWNLREGMAPADAQREAAMEGSGLEHGIVRIDGVPTKHYLREELEVQLADRHFAIETLEKLEYPWTTEFAEPPDWMKAPYPWDWFVVARRVR
ncbi:MAG: class I SAM-dependent methyltransferase [Flavobacteriales bacterium]